MSFEEMQECYELDDILASQKHGKTEKVTYRDPNGQSSSREGNPYIRKTLYEANYDIINLFEKIKNETPVHFAGIEDADLVTVKNLEGQSVLGTVMICEFLAHPYEKLEARYKKKFKEERYKEKYPNDWKRALNEDRDKIKFNCANLSRKNLKRVELEVANVAIVICEGLKYLHEKKYLHLDIKPDNIMVYPSQKEGDNMLNYSQEAAKSYPLKIIDYGNVWGYTGDVALDKRKNVNRTSMMSKGFSAPELVPDEFDFGVPGIYSDVYSVGALMKALLPDDYLTWDTLIRPRLQAVIEKAMEIAPEDRYQSMDEMIDALTLAKKPYPKRLWDSFKAKIFGAVGLLLLWTMMIFGTCTYYYEANVIPRLEEKLLKSERAMETNKGNLQRLTRKNKELEALKEELEKFKSMVHSEEVSFVLTDINGKNEWQYKVINDGETDVKQWLNLVIDTDLPKVLKNSTLTVEYIGLGLKTKKAGGSIQRENADLDDVALCHRLVYKNGSEQNHIKVDTLTTEESFVIEGENPMVKLILEAENLKKPIVKTVPVKLVK